MRKNKRKAFKLENYMKAFALNKSPPIPENVLLIFNRDIYKIIKQLSGGNEPENASKFHSSFFDTSIYEKRVRVFLTGDSAPIVAHSLEILIAKGAKFVIGLGYTASINYEKLKIGDFFIPVKIIIGDGISKKYTNNSTNLFSKFDIAKNVLNCISDESNTILGTCLSTDSYFIYTEEQITNLREKEILSIDMESGAFISVTKYYDIPSILVNIVSETLLFDDWIVGYPKARSKIKIFYNKLGKILNYKE